MGSQRHSEDFDGQIETNRLNFTEVFLPRRPAPTDLLETSFWTCGELTDFTLAGFSTSDLFDFQQSPSSGNEIRYWVLCKEKA